MAIIAVSVLRTVGFSATNLAVKESWAVGLMYATPVVGILGAAWIAMGQGRRVARIMDSLPAPQINIESLTLERVVAGLKSAKDDIVRRFGFSGWKAAR